MFKWKYVLLRNTDPLKQSLLWLKRQPNTVLENFRSYLWRNYKRERQDNFTSLHFFKIKQGKSKVVDTPHDNNSFLDK